MQSRLYCIPAHSTIIFVRKAVQSQQEFSGIQKSKKPVVKGRIAERDLIYVKSVYW